MKDQKSILRFISFFNSVVNNLRLYSSSHPQSLQRLKTSYRSITDLLKIRETITFILIENDLVVDKEPLRSREPHPGQFVNILQDAGLEMMAFEDGLESEEFEEFVMAFASPEKTDIQTSEHIKVGHVDTAGDGDEDDELSEEEKSRIKKLQRARTAGHEALKKMLSEMKKGQKIDVAAMSRQVRAIVDNQSAGINPIKMLMSMDDPTDYTSRHMINVCQLTISQASGLGFKRKHLKKIGIAALLFDVGKLFIPDEIITKPGALTPKERKVMETHTIKGARHILRMDEIPKLAVLCALEHHRKFDGTGYPTLAKGWAPNIVSQMVTISDSFDAMRSKRPFSSPKSIEKIIGIIKKESGTTFNPQLVSSFIKLILK